MRPLGNKLIFSPQHHLTCAAGFDALQAQPAHAMSHDDTESDSSFPPLSQILNFPSAKRKHHDNEQNGQYVTNWLREMEEGAHEIGTRKRLRRETLEDRHKPRSKPQNHPEDSAELVRLDPIVINLIDSSSESEEDPEIQVPHLSNEHPEVIHQKYVEARAAWYATQSDTIIKTDEAYRQAKALPLHYDETEYNWCRQQLSLYRPILRASVVWTEEQMMAWIDWNSAEDARVEAAVEREISLYGFGTRKGMGELMQRIE